MNPDSLTTPRRSQAPRGCNAKMLGVLLRPEERAEVVELATRENRTLSSMARELMVGAMESRRMREDA